jgi:hypothetical protein
MDLRATGLETASQKLPQQSLQLPLPVRRQSCPEVRRALRRQRAVQARGGRGARGVAGMRCLLPLNGAAGTIRPTQAAPLLR